MSNDTAHSIDLVEAIPTPNVQGRAIGPIAHDPLHKYEPAIINAACMIGGAVWPASVGRDGSFGNPNSLCFIHHRTLQTAPSCHCYQIPMPADQASLASI